VSYSTDYKANIMKSLITYIFILMMMSSTTTSGQQDQGIIILSDRFSSPISGAKVVVAGQVAEDIGYGQYRVNRPTGRKWSVAVEVSGYHPVIVANTEVCQGNVQLAKESEPTTFYYRGGLPQPIYTDSTAFFVVLNTSFQGEKLTPELAEKLLRDQIEPLGLIVKDAFYRMDFDSEPGDVESREERGDDHVGAAYTHCFYVSKKSGEKVNLNSSPDLAALRKLEVVMQAGPVMKYEENQRFVHALDHNLWISFDQKISKERLDELLKKFNLKRIVRTVTEYNGMKSLRVSASLESGFDMNKLRDSLMNEEDVLLVSQEIIAFVVSERD
jgi:hypothetical protein